MKQIHDLIYNFPLILINLKLLEVNVSLGKNMLRYANIVKAISLSGFLNPEFTYVGGTVVGRLPQNHPAAVAAEL